MSAHDIDDATTWRRMRFAIGCMIGVMICLIIAAQIIT